MPTIRVSDVTWEIVVKAAKSLGLKPVEFARSVLANAAMQALECSWRVAGQLPTSYISPAPPNPQCSSGVADQLPMGDISDIPADTAHTSCSSTSKENSSTNQKRQKKQEEIGNIKKGKGGKPLPDGTAIRLWRDGVLADNDRMVGYMEAYPALDLAAEIRRAALWLIENPTKRKRQMDRYLGGWLRRAQERGGGRSQPFKTSGLIQAKPEPQEPSCPHESGCEKFQRMGSFQGGDIQKPINEELCDGSGLLRMYEHTGKHHGTAQYDDGRKDCGLCERWNPEMAEKAERKDHQ